MKKLRLYLSYHHLKLIKKIQNTLSVIDIFKTKIHEIYLWANAKIQNEHQYLLKISQLT